MKQQVSPAVVGVAIVIVIGLLVFVWTRVGGVSHEEKPPPTMPESVAKEWNKYTQGQGGGPTASGGSSVPTNGGGTSIPSASGSAPR